MQVLLHSSAGRLIVFDTVTMRMIEVSALDKEFPSDVSKKQVSYVHLRPAHDVGIHQENMTAWRHLLPRC